MTQPRTIAGGCRATTQSKCPPACRPCSFPVASRGSLQPMFQGFSVGSNCRQANRGSERTEHRDALFDKVFKASFSLQLGKQQGSGLRSAAKPTAEVGTRTAHPYDVSGGHPGRHPSGDSQLCPSLGLGRLGATETV